MDLLNALQFLNLNQVPQDWVDAVWDLEFTERKPIEDIIEDKLRTGGEKSFRSLYYSLLDHAAEQQQSAGRDGASQGVWVILGENGVSLKSLVAVLSHFILAVRAKGASVQQRVCGLYAASVYLLLLGIPGEYICKLCSNSVSVNFAYIAHLTTTTTTTLTKALHKSVRTNKTRTSSSYQRVPSPI
ncbi:hypothetical protein ATANTOWER_020692 [Ataeniobius toweri]|uniref:Uncharacterized protein n=1 Tax=Ataeniobius toweri TaxID=208326 RepID=A0ABU7BK56_9TELE|nr:hypothetical protein [Ataeniobius toweri]